MSIDDSAVPLAAGGTSGALDVERDSDVPISTQIYWQLAYQIDSGRLLPGSRLPPVRELGAALRVNPNTIRAVYRRLADAGYVNSRHGAGTHVADRPPAATRRREPRRDRVRDAATGGATGVHARRARRRHLRGRHRAQAARAARPRALRRVHERRRRLRRRAAGRRVPGSHRGGGRAAGRPARAAGPVPLRPDRDDHLPRRRGPGAGRRTGPGRGDARRSGLSRAGPRDRRAAARGASRARLRLVPRHGQHPRDALDVGHAGRRDPLGDHRQRPGPRDDRPDRRHHPDVARGAGRRPRMRGSRVRNGSGRGPTSSIPAGLELLRRAVDHVAAGRPRETAPA